MKSKKDRAAELGQKVVHRTYTVFYALHRIVEQSPQEDSPALASLRKEMEEYQG